MPKYNKISRKRGLMLRFYTGEDGSQLVVEFNDKGNIEKIVSSEYCYVLDRKGTWTKSKLKTKEKTEE